VLFVLLRHRGEVQIQTNDLVCGTEKYEAKARTIRQKLPSGAGRAMRELVSNNLLNAVSVIRS
jgi:hypothetical protein